MESGNAARVRRSTDQKQRHEGRLYAKKPISNVSLTHQYKECVYTGQEYM